MKFIKRLILPLALGAVLVWLWTIIFPSPERIIRGRLADLASTISFTGKENVIVRANNIGKLSMFFGPEIEITVNMPDPAGNQFATHQIMGRDEITLAAQAAHTTGGPLKVEFLGPVVTLGADKESATVNVTMRAQVPRESDPVVQELKFTLKKVGKEWLIIRVETVRTLT